MSSKDPLADASCELERRRKIGIVSRRSEPQFFIVDSSFVVLHRSEGVSPLLASAEALRGMASSFQKVRQTGKSVIEAIDDETVLRIVPLRGGLAGCIEIFVDNFDRRTGVIASTKHFGLTKREADFLPLLLRGMTNSEMAASLFLAETTVADHLKSIMRKTKANKRSRIIARIYDLEDDNEESATTA